MLAVMDKGNNVRYDKSSILRNSEVSLLGFLQERSAKADTISIKVAPRLDPPLFGFPPFFETEAVADGITLVLVGAGLTVLLAAAFTLELLD
jgi:hypothetical protein